MIKDIDRRINRALTGIRQAFRGVLGIANTAPNIALVQIAGLTGETVQDNELFQHYGYSSNPPAGSAVIVLPLGGKSSQGVIIASEHAQFRVKNLKPGEVAIYTAEGDSIVLKNGHLIEVTTQTLKITATTKVDITTPLLQVNGGDIKADAISLKGHKHSDPQGGITGTPS